MHIQHPLPYNPTWIHVETISYYRLEKEVISIFQTHATLVLNYENQHLYTVFTFQTNIITQT